MKKYFTLLQLIVSVLVIHVLMMYTFMDKDIFYYVFSAVTLLGFTLYYFTNEPEKTDHTFSSSSAFYSVLLGGVLFLFFKLGFTAIQFLDSGLEKNIQNIVAVYGPNHIVEYILLLLLFIPGEEYLCRGFIQNLLRKYVNDHLAILFTSIIFASLFVYSDEPIWMFAAFLGSMTFGYIYEYFHQIKASLLAHYSFTLLLVTFL
ncbi:CPBP family intramembrane glutamic endopeptidase [Bacillus coahuilensis]|uniref:CPBP family intramembrane glutamic endopeptidase n=1 Tax=Bacillus coahuilensis TaxID=408580 RepID=UPI0001850BDB|nr:type II CAAX endopeptidase family protein [Bacillus coahuilensis]